MSKLLVGLVSVVALVASFHVGRVTASAKTVEVPVEVKVPTGLQPKYEQGFVIAVPCPDHGVDEFTIERVLVAYELSVQGNPFLQLATEEQVDEVLHAVK